MFVNPLGFQEKGECGLDDVVIHFYVVDKLFNNFMLVGQIFEELYRHFHDLVQFIASELSLMRKIHSSFPFFTPTNRLQIF